MSIPDDNHGCLDCKWCKHPNHDTGDYPCEHPDGDQWEEHWDDGACWEPRDYALYTDDRGAYPEGEPGRGYPPSIRELLYNRLDDVNKSIVHYLEEIENETCQYDCGVVYISTCNGRVITLREEQEWLKETLKQLNND